MRQISMIQSCQLSVVKGVAPIGTAGPTVLIGKHFETETWREPIVNSVDTEIAASQWSETLSKAGTRRSFLAGSAMAAAGIAALGSPTVFAAGRRMSSTSSSPDSVKTILTVARTAEQLAVTFYSSGIKHHEKLRLHGKRLDILKAAVIEEQIHHDLFQKAGGDSLAVDFSFPHGEKTFRDLKTFIATQQQLEGVFDSAFLAAIKEFCELGQPGLAQLAGQVATIESEHRALGRFLAGDEPADNWTFAPVLLKSVGDAPALVKQAGYLNPRKGNSFTYHHVDFTGLALAETYKRVQYKTPYVAL